MCVRAGSHLQVSAGYLKFEDLSFEENVASAKGGAISVILDVFVLAIFIRFPFDSLYLSSLSSGLCRCAKRAFFFFFFFLWLMHSHAVKRFDGLGP